MKKLLSHGQNFLDHGRIAKGLSAKTLSAYQIDLFQFTSFLQSNQPGSLPDAISKEIIQSYLAKLTDLYKPKTVKRKVATLKAYFNYLELESLIEVNPMRKLRIKIKEPFALPKYLTLHEVSKILKKADEVRRIANRTQDIRSRRLALRNLAILELLFATGIRVSELCSLKSEHMDLQSGCLRVKGKGEKERIIHFGHEPTMKIMHRYTRAFQSAIHETGYFFINEQGRQLATQSVRSIIQQICQGTDLKRHITPHVFRHTFATLLMEEGVDIKYIQQFLGHSSILTTQIYTHVSQRRQEELLLTKHPRGRI
jgi:integrase/recombinase XerD